MLRSGNLIRHYSFRAAGLATPEDGHECGVTLSRKREVPASGWILGETPEKKMETGMALDEDVDDEKRNAHRYGTAPDARLVRDIVSLHVEVEDKASLLLSIGRSLFYNFNPLEHADGRHVKYLEVIYLIHSPR